MAAMGWGTTLWFHSNGLHKVHPGGCLWTLSERPVTREDIFWGNTYVSIPHCHHCSSPSSFTSMAIGAIVDIRDVLCTIGRGGTFRVPIIEDKGDSSSWEILRSVGTVYAIGVIQCEG